MGEEALDYSVPPLGWKSYRHLGKVIVVVVVVVAVVVGGGCC